MMKFLVFYAVLALIALLSISPCRALAANLQLKSAVRDCSSVPVKDLREINYKWETDAQVIVKTWATMGGSDIFMKDKFNFEIHESQILVTLFIKDIFDPSKEFPLCIFPIELELTISELDRNRPGGYNLIIDYVTIDNTGKVINTNKNYHQLKLKN